MTCPEIDIYETEGNRLLIRGCSVTELASSQHYLQNVWLALTGEKVDQIHLDNKIRDLSLAFFTCGQIERLRKLSQSPDLSESVLLRFMMLLGRLNYADDGIRAVTPDECLQIILSLPILLQLARTPGTIGELSPAINAAGFCHDLLKAVSGQAPEISADKLSFFMSLLLGGFGVVAPTTAVVRFVASTKSSVSYALVAALCASGRAHLGACTQASLQMKSCHEALQAGNIQLAAEQYCGQKPWPGFGHPIMPEDPRVSAFFSYMGSDFAAFEALAFTAGSDKELKPNVDFMIASFMTHYRIEASLAVLFFFSCRAPVLLAHYREKFQRHAFGMASKELREKYNEVPKNWL